jgi:hypothetical protein
MFATIARFLSRIWLVTFAARSRAEPRIEMFSEYGLRAESEQLSASFDPFNFAVRGGRSHDIEAEVELIRAGKFDETKAMIAGKLNKLSSRRRISYALRVTSETHELRHYHDHFATTFGFSRIMATIQDGMDFSQMWGSLRKERRIKLPLLSWAKAEDAPEALRAYAAKRRSYAEWFVLNDGAVKATVNIFEHGKAPPNVPTDAICVISVGGVTTSIPMVDKILMRANTGQYIQKLLPLGGSILMEGSAFVVQRNLASRIFGKEYWELIKNAVSAGPVDDDQWLRYMAVDSYMSKRLFTHNEKFQLALCDIAMMPHVGEGEQFEDLHPGWRFFKAVNAAGEDHEILQRGDADLTEYMAKITSKCKWLSLLEVTRQAIKKWESALKRLDQPDSRTSFWAEISRAAINLHLKWMRVRERFPVVLVEPDLYYMTIGEMLPPPAYVKSDGIWFQGEQNATDARAFRQWFLFEHFQRQLLFSTELPCPISSYAAHKCPGDPLRKSDWESTDECLFSQLLDGLGISDISLRSKHQQ